VLFVTPRLPHFASDSVISSGSLRFVRNCGVQPPAVPYLVDPGIAAGWNPGKHHGTVCMITTVTVSDIKPTTS
jgi:hypothetical protein